MHRLKSKLTIYRFRFAALLFCAKHILFPVTCVIMAWAIMMRDHRIARLGLLSISLMVLVVILQWIVAARASCPLCMTAVLARKHCRTHRHARTLLGSYRLRVALSIVFKNTFCCQYCCESTALEVRQKSHEISRAGRD